MAKKNDHNDKLREDGKDKFKKGFEDTENGDGESIDTAINNVLKFKAKSPEAKRERQNKEKNERLDRDDKNSVGKKLAELIDLSKSETYTNLDDTEELLKAFNRRYFVIKDYFGECVVAEFKKNDQLELNTFGDNTFKKQYANVKFKVDGKMKSIADLWLEWSDRRQVEEVFFDPELPSGIYQDTKLNLWTGLACEEKEGNCESILQFHKEIVCNGDAELYEKLMDVLAYGVQKPWKRWNKAIICASKEEGSGKSLFSMFYSQLFGRHSLYISDSELLVGRFTGHLDGKVVISADEVAMCGKGANNRLKALVTESSQIIHHKGKTPANKPNYAKVIITTNADHAILASETARRWLCLKFASHRVGDLDYFKQLEHDYSHGGKEAFLYFLSHRDISAHNPYEIIETEMLKEQKELSLLPAVRVVLHLIETGGCPGEKNSSTGDRDGLWFATMKQIRDYTEQSDPETRKASSQEIAKALRAIGFDDKFKDGRVRWWFPKLEDARNRWNSIHNSNHKWNDRKENGDKVEDWYSDATY